jgi:hypothetical protein
MQSQDTGKHGGTTPSTADDKRQIHHEAPFPITGPAEVCQQFRVMMLSHAILVTNSFSRHFSTPPIVL